ncbi:transcription factor, MADS-box [Tanacetum coccineum]
MELINNEKKCKLAFIRRKECTFKKAQELATKSSDDQECTYTLCDVNVSMFISSDDQESPEILKDMINVYKRNRANRKIRSCFKDGKDKIEGELVMTKNDNLEGKYPTSNHSFGSDHGVESSGSSNATAAQGYKRLYDGAIELEVVQLLEQPQIMDLLSCFRP